MPRSTRLFIALMSATGFLLSGQTFAAMGADAAPPREAVEAFLKAVAGEKFQNEKDDAAISKLIVTDSPLSRSLADFRIGAQAFAGLSVYRLYMDAENALVITTTGADGRYHFVVQKVKDAWLIESAEVVKTAEMGGRARKFRADHPAAKMISFHTAATHPAASQPATQPALPPMEESPWRATLSDGTVIELLAVAPHPSTGKDWWLADGSPTKSRPYELGSRPFKGDPGLVLYEVVFRISNRPADKPPVGLKWFARDNTRYLGWALPKVAGVTRREADLPAIVIGVPEGDQKATLLVGGIKESPHDNFLFVNICLDPAIRTNVKVEEGPPKEKPVPVDPETVEQLRSLGYLR